MKRYIRLKVNKKKNTLQIVKQTHRERIFTINEINFKASNGFKLYSISYPESDGINMQLCVRGSQSNKNNEKVSIPSKKWLKKCMVAVREYNSKKKTFLVD